MIVTYKLLVKHNIIIFKIFSHFHFRQPIPRGYNFTKSQSPKRSKKRMNSVANLPLFAASVSTKRTTVFRFSNNKLRPIRSMRAVVQRVASASVQVSSLSLFSSLNAFLNRRCEILHFTGRWPHRFRDRPRSPRARRPSRLRLRHRR